MDSKAVNKEIASCIRPLLKSAGFSEFAVRSAWRFTPNRTHMVNFQSFNSHLASSLGCTTFSFGINFGCALHEVPYDMKVKEKNGKPLPAEYLCHLRTKLKKTLLQESFPRQDIWYIDPEGNNLAAVMSDAEKVLRARLSWFSQFDDNRDVLAMLLGHSEDNELWGFGNNPSPRRSFLTGYIAKALGDATLAREKLLHAVNSGSYDGMRAGIDQALQELKRGPAR